MATKCQSVDCREKEAVAKATERQSAECREREAQAMDWSISCVESNKQSRLVLSEVANCNLIMAKHCKGNQNKNCTRSREETECKYDSEQI